MSAGYIVGLKEELTEEIWRIEGIYFLVVVLLSSNVSSLVQPMVYMVSPELPDGLSSCLAKGNEGNDRR